VTRWRSPRRLILVAIGAIAAIVGPFATSLLTLTAERSPALLLADLAVGWAMIAAGLAIADRRPGNRVGPLAILAGFAWFAGDLASAPWAAIAYVGQVLHGWFDPLFALVILAYPTGRIDGRPARLLAIGFLVVQGAWTLVKAYALRPIAWWPCPTCLSTVDSWIDARIAMDDLGRLETAALTMLSLGVLVLVVARWLRASGAARRRTTPVLAAGIVLALGFTGGFLLQTILPASARTEEGELRVIVLAILRIGVAVGLLVGVLRDDSTRGRIADLVVSIDRLPSAPDLRSALREALGDPSLEVYRWDATIARYRDADGTPSTPPQDGPDRAVVTLSDDTGPGLRIALDPVLREDPGSVSAAVAAVRMAVENERLQAEVQAQLQDVRASRARIVEAQDAERRRLERNLHDGAQQRLISLQMSLQLLRRQLPPDADPVTFAELDAASAEADAAIREIRELARGVHPAILTESGLGPALASLADRAPIPVTLDVDIDVRPPASVEATAYFVVAEALSNTARHASASAATVRGWRSDDMLRLEITDDGRGGASPDGGTGLRGLADRVAALGGSLTLVSPPDAGTRLLVELPCASP
jgi:signal transduction histidine kinase